MTERSAGKAASIFVQSLDNAEAGRPLAFRVPQTCVTSEFTFERSSVQVVYILYVLWPTSQQLRPFIKWLQRISSALASKWVPYYYYEVKCEICSTQEWTARSINSDFWVKKLKANFRVKKLKANLWVKKLKANLWVKKLKANLWVKKLNANFRVKLKLKRGFFPPEWNCGTGCTSGVCKKDTISPLQQGRYSKISKDIHKIDKIENTKIQEAKGPSGSHLQVRGSSLCP